MPLRFLVFVVQGIDARLLLPSRKKSKSKDACLFPALQPSREAEIHFSRGGEFGYFFPLWPIPRQPDTFSGNTLVIDVYGCGAYKLMYQLSNGKEKAPQAGNLGGPTFKNL